jgi:hypothetical protein
MREEFVIVEPFSGRYYAGNTNDIAVFDVKGGRYMPFSTRERAEEAIKHLRVAPYTRLKIEKHYVSE